MGNTVIHDPAGLIPVRADGRKTGREIEAVMGASGKRSQNRKQLRE